MNINDIILYVPIGSTSGSGGAVGDRFLDGGWDRVYSECIEPYIGKFKDICFWNIGGYDRLFGNKIPFSVLPNPRTNFRVDIDPRVEPFVWGYSPFAERLGQELNSGIYSYAGCIPFDDNLNDCFLRGDSDYYGELRRQVRPYRGTTVIVDAWATATRSDIRTFRTIMQETSTGGSHLIPGVEGTQRVDGDANATRLESWWLCRDRLTGPAMMKLSDVKDSVRGPKVEMFTGMHYSPSQKIARIEYLASMGIRSCCDVRDI